MDARRRPRIGGQRLVRRDPIDPPDLQRDRRRQDEADPRRGDERGSRTLFGAGMFGAESDGTPDARYVYYNYPTSGDGAMLARLDNIAAAKNPACPP
jgi:hypothetical protein